MKIQQDKKNYTAPVCQSYRFSVETALLDSPNFGEDLFEGSNELIIPDYNEESETGSL